MTQKVPPSTFSHLVNSSSLWSYVSSGTSLLSSYEHFLCQLTILHMFFVWQVRRYFRSRESFVYEKILDSSGIRTHVPKLGLVYRHSYLGPKRIFFSKNSSRCSSRNSSKGFASYLSGIPSGTSSKILVIQNKCSLAILKTSFRKTITDASIGSLLGFCQRIPA